MGTEESFISQDTVCFHEDKGCMVIIDQTRLPFETRLLELYTQREIHDAIYLLQVRGAPAIGVAAAIGYDMAARELASQTESKTDFLKALKQAKDYLASSRPTAVNLFWALERMEQVTNACQGESIAVIVGKLHQEAKQIHDEDIEVCKRIGEYGITLIEPKNGILTHCNAGKLATVQYGTATAPMYLAKDRGYELKIFADETRPLLQGARLTAYELKEAGMDVTLICDNMASSVMKRGWIQAVFVGCDRVAANGDVANKIGTSGVAILAKHYQIPMYVCAPTSTIDLNTEDGEHICIEERPGEEITHLWYENPMGPEDICTYNPCFDVTDHELVTAIITENGIAYPPYSESLADVKRNK